MNHQTYSSSDYLQSDEDILEYLNAALEDSDPRVLLLALRNVAIARGGMAKLAESTGLNRESLYKALSENGNPHYGTIAIILHGLGFQLTISKDMQRMAA